MKPSPPLAKGRKKSTKSVRFGTLVTFEDGGTPVPIRPARRKSNEPQRSSSTPGKLTHQLTRKRSNQLVDLPEPQEDFAPEKPRRVYAGRKVTASNLSEALQDESTLEKIKRLMKTVEQQSREDQNKKRTVLSALNLFLSLAYERLRDPAIRRDNIPTKPPLVLSVTDGADDKSLAKFDVSLLGNIDPPSSTRIPTAVEQLRGKQGGTVYLRNIPTLLLFNLIFGRSL